MKMFANTFRAAGLVPFALLLLAQAPMAWAQVPADPFHYTRVSSFEYDPVTGAVTAEIVEPDNPQLCVRTEYKYDPVYGTRTSLEQKNCAGATGAASFTAHKSETGYGANAVNPVAGQYATSAKNALNQTVRAEYDPRFGAVTKEIAPNGLTLQRVYDSFGRKVREIVGDGNQTRWDYYYCSNTACPASGLNPIAWYVEETPLDAAGVQNGPISRSYIDVLGREVRSQSQGFNGAFVQALKEFDGRGRLARTSAPHLVGGSAVWTTYHYDELGRLLREERPDPQASGGVAVSKLAYNGLTVRSTNALGQEMLRESNSQGQVARVTDNKGNQVAYQYDAFGRLLRTTDFLGNTSTATYDIRGNRVSAQDPDQGSWSYVYNALGQLVSQTNARQQVTTLQYDVLGRPTARLSADLKSYWRYETYADGTACPGGVGKLCETWSENGYSRRHAYDSFGRPVLSRSTLGTTYSSKLSYDAAGRVAVQVWPTGFATKNVYTSLGFLAEVRDAATDALYWKALSYNPRGQLTGHVFGNNIETMNVYDEATGRLNSILAGASGNAGSGSRLHLRYTYDALSNVQTRTNASTGVIETFGYDDLNRLTSQAMTAAGTSRPVSTWDYDPLGNIKIHSETGTYSYNPAGSARPHAVSGITGARVGSFNNPQYTYDAEGNVTRVESTGAGNNGVVRLANWTSFGMPSSISKNNGASVAFTYDSDYRRVREEFTRVANGVTQRRTVVSVNPGNGTPTFESEQKEDGTFEHRHYVAGVLLVRSTAATGAVPSDPVPTALPAAVAHYWHKDNLGSTTLVTNGAGGVVESLAYDPFGKRRYPGGGFDPNDVVVGASTPRGFTGHEHLEDLALVHMNGRIFDPAIGRFLSADPFVQDPNNLQSHNRYSYVFNNPLNSTDPSGFLSLDWDDVADVAEFFVGGGVRQTTREVLSHVSYSTGQTLVNLGSSLCLGYAPMCAAVGSYENARAHGASPSDARRAAAISGLTVYASDLVGDWTSHNPQFMSGTHLANIAGHAAVGCLSSEASGGNCGVGAASGAVSAFVAPKVAKGLDGLLIASISGGIAADLSGGKFADGARTAAYTHLYNSCRGDLAACLNPSAPGGPVAAAAQVQAEAQRNAALAADRLAGDVGWNLGEFFGNLFKKPSAILADNMVIAGDVRNGDDAAHHIVAWDDGRAAGSRDILATFNVDINSAANGVFLPRAQHDHIHTDFYHFAVNMMLAPARSQADVIATLAFIRTQIQIGAFPP